MEPWARIGRDLDTCKRDPPPIKLMGYEDWEGAVEGWGSRQWKTHTNTHRHTHSVPCDLQGGWSLGQRSEAILTHVSIAPH